MKIRIAWQEWTSVSSVFFGFRRARAIFIDKYTISVIEVGNDVEGSTKSRVSVGIQGAAFLYRRDGNPGSRVSRFGCLTRDSVSAAHVGSSQENKARSKRLRTQHGHSFRRGNSRRNNRRENPWIQAERCIHFQRCTLRRVNCWRKALHAASQA
jgi:hypothetical protein